MHPLMEVQISTVEGKRQYELKLSRANFNHFCAGCPEFDRVAGFAKDGAAFYIFENPHGEMPKSFSPLPNGEGYFAYVGSPAPRIPQGVSNDEFIKLANQYCNILEKTINESGRIPIEENTRGGKINLGYVVMSVEKAN